MRSGSGEWNTLRSSKTRSEIAKSWFPGYARLSSHRCTYTMDQKDELHAKGRSKHRPRQPRKLFHFHLLLAFEGLIGSFSDSVLDQARGQSRSSFASRDSSLGVDIACRAEFESASSRVSKLSLYPRTRCESLRFVYFASILCSVKGSSSR